MKVAYMRSCIALMMASRSCASARLTRLDFAGPAITGVSADLMRSSLFSDEAESCTVVNYERDAAVIA
eukprot:IDg2066t1